MKKIAHTFHHTHWDNEWYFTEQEAQVQLVYHMDELFHAFDEGLIEKYLLDGKSDSVEDYLLLQPESKEKLKQLVKDKKLFIGPFYSHLSAFISPGESVIKNLEIGMEIADDCGGSSLIAYMPDSFGQIQDYPKIFNGYRIKDFVFRRGMGDVHHLKNDFIWKSNDGSEILCNVLQSGYSFAGLAFMEGRLINNAGLNLDKKDIVKQIYALANGSGKDNEFLFPAGKDNCPVILNFKDLLKQYSEESADFEFKETTLEEYMENMRAEMENLETYVGEFYTTQYHRVHKSIFSARPDIKILQDKIERLLLFEVQPLMSMLDKIGIPYKREMINSVWKLLLRSQTHSEATNSDVTNEQILKRAEKAFIYANSIKTYLTRKIAISVPKEQGNHSFVIFNTLPEKRTLTAKVKVFTKESEFKLLLEGKEVPYTVIKQESVYGGWIRKNKELMDHGKDYYLTHLTISLEEFPGLSYHTIYIEDKTPTALRKTAPKGIDTIENERYQIAFVNGSLLLRDMVLGREFKDCLYFEDTGDQGDTFDYDYPDQDFTIIDKLNNSGIVDAYQTDEMGAITLQGSFNIPKDLSKREKGISNSEISYLVTLRVRKQSDVIEVFGEVDNNALNHRLRLVLETPINAKESIAGTQFGFIRRTNVPEELGYWKEQKWLEEPTPIEPLLNHVSLEEDNFVSTVFTRGTKEYEIIGDEKNKIALTIFRAVGHFGLPDLNRRPGRASGTPEKVFDGPLSQVIGKNTFAFGISFYSSFDGNQVQKDYVTFATDPVYFQDQEFNRLFTPMKYFETNSLTFNVPTSYQLMELKNSNLVFSTLQKSKYDDATILRLYNNENHEIDGGELKINFDYHSILRTDLAENHLSETDLSLGRIKPGEIVTLKFLK